MRGNQIRPGIAFAMTWVNHITGTDPDNPGNIWTARKEVRVLAGCDGLLLNPVELHSQKWLLRHGNLYMFLGGRRAIQEIRGDLRFEVTGNYGTTSDIVDILCNAEGVDTLMVDGKTGDITSVIGGAIINAAYLPEVGPAEEFVSNSDGDQLKVGPWYRRHCAIGSGAPFAYAGLGFQSEEWHKEWTTPHPIDERHGPNVTKFMSRPVSQIVELASLHAFPPASRIRLRSERCCPTDPATVPVSVPPIIAASALPAACGGKPIFLRARRPTAAPIGIPTAVGMSWALIRRFMSSLEAMTLPPPPFFFLPITRMAARWVSPKPAYSCFSATFSSAS